MTVWVLIIWTLALVVGIAYGIYHIVQSERHTDNLIKVLAKVGTQLDGVASYLKTLGEDTIKAIGKNGEDTIKAIEKNGEDTIKAIEK